MNEACKQTILVVDDSRNTRVFCEKLLQREGYCVARATNGAEAIEVAQSVVPHVIIMDVMMPVMDGLEATRELRSNPVTSRIPIIMVSGKVKEQDLTAGLAAGADEYLFKPIRPREFQLRVRSMVRLREAQLQIEQTNASLQQQTTLLAKLNQFV